MIYVKCLFTKSSIAQQCRIDVKTIAIKYTANKDLGHGNISSSAKKVAYDHLKSSSAASCES